MVPVVTRVTMGGMVYTYTTWREEWLAFPTIPMTLVSTTRDSWGNPLYSTYESAPVTVQRGTLYRVSYTTRLPGATPYYGPYMEYTP